MKYKKVIVVGTGKLAFDCALVASQYNLECEICEYGNNNISQLEFLCRNRKMKYSKYEKEQLTNYLSHIVEKALIVSANNTYIFPKDIIKKDNFFIINFHPALLPKHPGRNAEAWSIYEGDSISGISWHVVSEQVDKGDIIYQKEILINEKTTSLILMSQQFKLASIIFSQIIENIVKNTVDVMHQSDNRTYKLHKSYEIPNNGILDETWSLEQKSRFLRAMDYGKMRLLGDPKVQRNKKFYIWDRYIIGERAQKEFEEKNHIYIEDNRYISLVNFREDDNGR